MNLTTARDWVRTWARNAGSSAQYSNSDIDRAILTVGSRFCRNTKALAGSTIIALAVNDESFDLDSAPRIMPENLLSLTLSDGVCPLKMIDFVEINALRQTPSTSKPLYGSIIGDVAAPVGTYTSAGGGISDESDFAINNDVSNQPPANFGTGWRITYNLQTRRVATWNPVAFTGTVDEPFSAPMEGGNDVLLFEWPTTAAPAAPWGGNFNILIYPTNDAARTVTARFWLPFTDWTPGASDSIAQTVVFNIPDAWLYQILPYGPTAILQYNQPEMRYASDAWQKYLAVEKSFCGAGIPGLKVLDRCKRR